MSFDKLYAWAIGVVLAFSAIGQLDALQSWIWKAQARVLYESRTSTWGSPRFFPKDEFKHPPNMRGQKRHG
jgi:hypothetical protein